MQDPSNVSGRLRLRSIGGGRATAYVRTHQFQIGAPVQFNEEYDQITALEYALAALGADLVNGFQIVASRRRIRIDNIEAVVTGALNNPLVYLGVVGEEGHPGLERVAVCVYVSSDEDEGELQQAWAETLERSPLLQTLQHAVELDLRIAAVP